MGRCPPGAMISAIAAFVAVLGLSCFAPFPVLGTPIYGEDNRCEPSELADPRCGLGDADPEKVLRLARSTVALFSSERVKTSGASVLLTLGKYGEDGEKLVKGERYYGQLKGAFCSGALVGPDLVLTAGHCVKSSKKCKGTRFIFDFAILEGKDSPLELPKSSDYGCKELVASVDDFPGARKAKDSEKEGTPGGEDWALVRLDKPVTDRPPLDVDFTPLAVGEPVFIIGYPYGLPLKVAGGAEVLRDYRDFFVSYLDAFPDNSGSPVFSARTLRIAGLLVRGEDREIAYQLPAGVKPTSETRGRINELPQDMVMERTLSEKGKEDVTVRSGQDVTKTSAFAAALRSAAP